LFFQQLQGFFGMGRSFSGAAYRPFRFLPTLSRTFVHGIRSIRGQLPLQAFMFTPVEKAADSWTAVAYMFRLPIVVSSHNLLTLEK